jgi:hypothetical protein
LAHWLWRCSSQNVQQRLYDHEQLHW